MQPRLYCLFLWRDSRFAHLIEHLRGRSVLRLWKALRCKRRLNRDAPITKIFSLPVAHRKSPNATPGNLSLIQVHYKYTNKSSYQALVNVAPSSFPDFPLCPLTPSSWVFPTPLSLFGHHRVLSSPPPLTQWDVKPSPPLDYPWSVPLARAT